MQVVCFENWDKKEILAKIPWHFFNYLQNNFWLKQQGNVENVFFIPFKVVKVNNTRSTVIGSDLAITIVLILADKHFWQVVNILGV